MRKEEKIDSTVCWHVRQTPTPRTYPAADQVGVAGSSMDGESELASQSSKGMLNRETSSANGADALMALSLPLSSFPQTLQEHRKPPRSRKPACGLWLLAPSWRSAGRGSRPWHQPSSWVLWAQNLVSARSHGLYYPDASEDAGSCG